MLFSIGRARRTRTALLMGTDHARVRLSEVRKSFDGSSPTLRDVDLSAAPGECLTLFGPPGSGASTCAMLLAGFETPTAGTIHLADAPLTDVPPAARNIGVVFHDHALFPGMTVTENVAFPLRARGCSRADVRTRVQTMLARLELTPLAHRRPAQLAVEQRLRVALARALVFEPALLLLDDPLAGLDSDAREQARHELRSLHNELGLTTLHVTCDPVEALGLSDRVAVFNEGVIEQVGDPETVYTAPASAAVARAFGGHECLAGRVIGRDDAGCSVELDAVAGDPIRCPRSDAVAEGARVVVALRADALVVEPAGDSCVNTLEGTVRERFYRGRETCLQVAIGGNEAANMAVILAGQAPRALPEPGASIRIGWPAAAVRVFAVGAANG